MSYRSGMRFALVAHLVTKPWNQVPGLGPHGNWKSCVMSYLYFHKEELKLKVLQKRSDFNSFTCERDGFYDEVEPSTLKRNVDLVIWS